MPIISQPDHGDKIVDKEGLFLSNFQIFIDDIATQFNLLETAFNSLEAQINPVLQLNLFTVATLPVASISRGALIYVTDAAGGELPAFSDGIIWRRVTDRTDVTT